MRRVLSNAGWLLVLVVVCIGTNGELCAQAEVPTWNGSFNYAGSQWTYVMIGTDPSRTSGTTTVPVYLIPVAITIAGTVFDPSTVLNNVLASPIFCQPSGTNQCSIDFTSGGNDLGVTQYLDAFQRANFWIYDSSTSYHLLLGAPTVINENVTIPSSVAGIFSDGQGWVDEAWWQRTYETQVLNSLVQSGQISQSGLTIFLVHDVCAAVYLLNFGFQCKYWGYHTDTEVIPSPPNSPQLLTWIFADYNDISDVQYRSVDILSHEVGEWADDPYFSNSTYCGLLEVGDPLAGTDIHDYQYGNYYLQDLVFLAYFGANIDTSVNDQYSFRDETLSVCEYGP